jgi:tetratricopeptide (TPR) repeat protein
MLVEAPLRSVSSDRELFKGIDDRRDSAEPATAQVALQASAVAWESPIAATPLATLEISKYIPTGARLQDDELTIFYREISKMEMAFAADPNRPGQLMLVQANHFWRGEREYQRRSIAQAIECFERVLDLDRHSSLAQRACYRLARIYYDELADFERAQPVYAECLGSVDDGLFSGEETRDIRLRSLRLTQYADCEWRPLNDLREIRLSPWPDVPRAVERLARDPRSLELIPEAADFVVRRVTEAPREIDAQLARLLIEIISEPVEALANDESRARVYLAIGDIHLNKFNDLNRSLAAYDRALELARETSWAPQIRERARMIRTSLLDPPGRRR